jgi:hypothetical protein
MNKSILESYDKYQNPDIFQEESRHTLASSPFGNGSSFFQTLFLFLLSPRAAPVKELEELKSGNTIESERVELRYSRRSFQILVQNDLSIY